ncbi:hypothetical protein [Agrococcus beijingensis]|uniref:hypothetical protein n=1 Tax=Agrococcus beijingensis TaxID=3068634 RepID=UPI0027428746|nr:hypothetical protein [Agrococcus sp. REN33]
MHYLLGLAALLIGVVIATRRTRPMWFVVLTGVLVGVGALLAILSYTRVTDGLGLVANNVLGWVFVGLSLITMLSAVFVLERRGERGEELPPLIGDNPFDGDTDDSDDPARGQAGPASTAAPAVRAERAAAAESRAEAQGAAGMSAGLAGGAGAAAATAAAFGDGVVPTVHEIGADPTTTRGGTLPSDSVAGAETGAADQREPEQGGTPGTPGGTLPEAHAPHDGDERRGFTAAPEEGHQGRDDEHSASEPAGDRPGPSDVAVDGTTVVGADPDIATDPAETDVDAAPEGGVDDDRTDGGDRT